MDYSRLRDAGRLCLCRMAFRRRARSEQKRQPLLNKRLGLAAGR